MILKLSEWLKFNQMFTMIWQLTSNDASYINNLIFVSRCFYVFLFSFWNIFFVCCWELKQSHRNFALFKKILFLSFFKGRYIVIVSEIRMIWFNWVHCFQMMLYKSVRFPSFKFNSHGDFRDGWWSYTKFLLCKSVNLTC